MKQNLNLQSVRREYLDLRDTLFSLQLATVDSDGFPEASYAPFAWYNDACFLFLSQLARHTQNLERNPSISLLLIEDESKTRHLFARRRIIWHGQVQIIARETEMFATVMQVFKSRFGDFIDIIQPLQDFQLFRVVPESGRFIRGFAQAFQLQGEGLNEIVHINPNGSSTS